jgi:type I restriction enzyme M protein
VKIFNTEDFGYQRITVERPLKLRFEITDDTLAALADAKPLAKFEDRDALIDAFKTRLGSVWWTKQDARIALIDTLVPLGLRWPGTIAYDKAIWSAIGVTDPNGEVQTTKDGPVPDPDLRDYENVPLRGNIDDYFAREVQPHVPDAWIDKTKTKIGYEIPLTRYFYVYKPPRLLAEIDGELKELERKIQQLLGQVTE